MECARQGAARAAGGALPVTLALLAVMAAFVGGCAGGEQHVVLELPEGALPEPPSPRVPTELTEEGLLPEFILDVGDQIAVEFFYNPEFSRELTVRPDGCITMPPFGDLRAAGRTPESLAAELKARYAEILLDPSVTVGVRSLAKPEVYVIGLVVSPGAVPYTRGLTAARAIAAAGGPKLEAKLGSVIVLRRLDRKRISASRIDVGEMFHAEGFSGDMYLQPYDIVVVPKRFVSQLREFSFQLLTSMTSLLNVLYLRVWD